MRTTVEGVSKMGRSTRGVRVVNLQKGDTVAALAVLGHDDLERKVEGDAPAGEADGQTDSAAAAPESPVTDGDAPVAANGLAEPSTDGSERNGSEEDLPEKTSAESETEATTKQ